MAICFARNSSVHAMEPVTEFAGRYQDHTLLLAVALHSEQHGGSVEVHPAVEYPGAHHRFVAFRPEELLALARQIYAAQSPEK